MTSERVSPILATWENKRSFSTSATPASIAALDAEGEDAAGALRAIAPRQLMIAIVGQAGVGDPADLIVRGQMLGDRQRVVAMALHAQRQRLDPGQDQERIERRDRRAEIA